MAHAKSALAAPLLLLLVAALMPGASAAAQAATTTAGGQASARALLLALQQGGTSATAASASKLLTQINALRPAGAAVAAGAATAAAPVPMPPALLTDLAKLLASAGTEAQLQALLAAGGLAQLPAPYNRAQRCAELKKTAVSAAVKACYCGAKPWMYCDALLHLELTAAAAQMDAAAKQMAKPSAAAVTARPSANAARRLLQSKCGNATALSTLMAASSTGCLSLACAFNVDNIPLSVKLNLNGCAPTMVLADTNANGVVGDGDSVKLCSASGLTAGKCTSLPFLTAAQWSTAAPYFATGITGSLDVCLGFPALTPILAKFGVTSNVTWCPTTAATGTLYPLKRQIGVNGRVSAMILSQGVWADLAGIFNIASGASNPACKAFSPYDATWRCRDFCAWSAGNGQLTANLGWRILWSTSTVTKTLINSPIAC